MVKSGTFTNWIYVRGSGFEFASLVNPANIENIYVSEGWTIVCLTSGKKLTDRRSITKFLKEEGTDKGVEVTNYGREMQEIEEKRAMSNTKFYHRTDGRHV